MRGEEVQSEAITDVWDTQTDSRLLKRTPSVDCGDQSCSSITRSRNSEYFDEVTRAISTDATEAPIVPTYPHQNTTIQLEMAGGATRNNTSVGGPGSRTNGQAFPVSIGQGEISRELDNAKTLNVRRLVEKVNSSPLPYIWAEDYEELLGAVPLLSRIRDGISDDFDPSPLIFVTNLFWCGGGLKGRILKLETRRVWSYTESVELSAPTLYGPPATFGPSSSNINNTPVSDGESIDSDAELLYPDESFDVKPGVPVQSEYTNTRVAQSQGNSNPHGSLPPLAPASTMVEGHALEIPPYDNEPSRISFIRDTPKGITTLLKAYKGGMPVSVVAETDWLGFSFNVPLSCRFAVLGFFHIVDVETSYDPLPPTSGKRSSLCVQKWLRWRFTLRWLPAGPVKLSLPIEIDGRPRSFPATPWWTSSEPESTTNLPSSPSREFFEPYIVRASILAPTILRDAYEDGKTDASKRSWLCRRCHKLNSTNWIGKYVCSFCGFEKAGLKRLLLLSSVRDERREIPMWEPSMRVPKGVRKEAASFKNQMKLFTFTSSYYRPMGRQFIFNDDLKPLDLDLINSTNSAMGGYREKKKKGEKMAVLVTHHAVMPSPMTATTVRIPCIVRLLFPGNRVELEKDADTLFIGFQKEVPMRFERSDFKTTAGVYTFMTSPEVTDTLPLMEGYSNWNTAPKCIENSRKLMIGYISFYLGTGVGPNLRHFSAVAWLGESPIKKVFRVHAKENPTLLMCLGADLDIVLPESGLRNDMKSPSGSSSSPRKKPSDGERHDDENLTSKAGINGEIWANQDENEMKKVVSGPGGLRITLTHGSVAVLSGDIDLTVIRSNFAILLILSDGQGARTMSSD